MSNSRKRIGQRCGRSATPIRRPWPCSSHCIRLRLLALWSRRLPPGHIKIIGVPMFVNSTPVFEIEQKITAKVISELIGRGRYEVRPNREGVDAVLIGDIHGDRDCAGGLQRPAAGHSLCGHDGRQDRVPRSQDR